LERLTSNPLPAALPDLTPLALQREGHELEFTLRTQQDILAQLPDEYERLLAERLAGTLAEQAPLTARINLQNLSAVSSRQLGSLIALGKVLRPRFGKVLVVGVSPGIRHLLQMTRTDQFFTVAC
jgi:anti-anti-sigma regulatory factor